MAKRRYPKRVYRSIMAHDRYVHNNWSSKDLERVCKSRYHNIVSEWQYENYKIMPYEMKKKVYEKALKDTLGEMEAFDRFFRAVGTAAKNK